MSAPSRSSCTASGRPGCVRTGRRARRRSMPGCCGSALASRTSAHQRPVLRAASRGNRSKLWLGMAAVLGLPVAAAGGARRSAGCSASAISSAVVNGPLKYVLAPPAAGGANCSACGRSLIAMPGSFSFPSGHSASAFAFATGVAREWPAAGAPVGAAAALVAYSRVHTGVHFPGDVARRRRHRHRGRRRWPAGCCATTPASSCRRPTDARSRTAAVLLASPTSGSAELLDDGEGRAQGVAASRSSTSSQVEDKDRAGRGRRACRPGERPLVIAAGGDGTVGAAADELAGTGAVLAHPAARHVQRRRPLAGHLPRPACRRRGRSRNGVVRAIDAGQVTRAGQAAAQLRPRRDRRVQRALRRARHQVVAAPPVRPVHLRRRRREGAAPAPAVRLRAAATTGRPRSCVSCSCRSSTRRCSAARSTCACRTPAWTTAAWSSSPSRRARRAACCSARWSPRSGGAAKGPACARCARRSCGCTSTTRVDVALDGEIIAQPARRLRGGRRRAARRHAAAEGRPRLAVTRDRSR